MQQRARKITLLALKNDENTLGMYQAKPTVLRTSRYGDLGTVPDVSVPKVTATHGTVPRSPSILTPYPSLSIVLLKQQGKSVPEGSACERSEPASIVSLLLRIMCQLRIELNNTAPIQ